MAGARAALLAFLLVAGTTGVLLYPLCAILHRCGCVGPWSGGAALCNVHQASGPHCPWCEYPAVGALATLGLVALQGIAFRKVWARRRRLMPSVLASVAVLPPALFLTGAAAWLLTDYPHFLALDTRTRLGVPPGPLHCVKPPPVPPPSCGAPSRRFTASPSP
jgi:hypothetical protein